MTTPHDKKLPIDREKTTADDADRYNLGVTLLDSNEGIKDVIGQKPSMQAMKEMNTPLVPEGSKERTKTSGIVRMKNVGSPKSEWLCNLVAAHIYSMKQSCIIKAPFYHMLLHNPID